ncbi:MAG: hypothetical protein V1833_02415 [Elusimicrobiota bacterium]
MTKPKKTVIVTRPHCEGKARSPPDSCRAGNPDFNTEIATSPDLSGTAKCQEIRDTAVVIGFEELTLFPNLLIFITNNPSDAYQRNFIS